MMGNKRRGNTHLSRRIRMEAKHLRGFLSAPGAPPGAAERVDQAVAEITAVNGGAICTADVEEWFGFEPGTLMDPLDADGRWHPHPFSHARTTS